jgi:hypothetical protein
VNYLLTTAYGRYGYRRIKTIVRASASSRNIGITCRVTTWFPLLLDQVHAKSAYDPFSTLGVAAETSNVTRGVVFDHCLSMSTVVRFAADDSSVRARLKLAGRWSGEDLQRSDVVEVPAEFGEQFWIHCGLESLPELINQTVRCLDNACRDSSSECAGTTKLSRRTKTDSENGHKFRGTIPAVHRHKLAV